MGCDVTFEAHTTQVDYVSIHAPVWGATAYTKKLAISVFGSTLFANVLFTLAKFQVITSKSSNNTVKSVGANLPVKSCEL